MRQYKKTYKSNFTKLNLEVKILEKCKKLVRHFKNSFGIFFYCLIIFLDCNALLDKERETDIFSLY